MLNLTDQNRFVWGSSNKVALALSMSFLLQTLPVRADEYHYNNILIGDRAAGMGGAYVAISDDPSGLYYNPAGIAYAQGSNVSVSANSFHQTSTTYKSVLGGQDYVRESSALLPNFFGIVQPLGKGRVGFSYAVPDSILEDQNQTFYNLPGTTTTRYAINFNRNDNTYNFGPSYAIELTDSFSIGATLYAHVRQNEWIQNQLINKNTGKYEWSNLFYKNTEWGIKPIIGAMWSPTSKLAAGLAISKVSLINSNTKYQAICSGDTAGSCQGLDSAYQLGTAPVRLINPSTSKRIYPVSTRLGVAYFPSKELILSGDFTYHSSIKDPEFGDKMSTWNVALGAEYYWSEKWAIRAGLFSDRANTPVVNSGDVNALDHVDLYGGSLSVSYFTRQSSLTIGGAYRYGIGRAQILGDARIQELKSQALTAFLSAAYFY